MNLKDRLKEYISYKGLTVQRFEDAVGVANGSVNKMGDNTRMSTLDKISEAFPDLDMIWLRTGVGSMLKGNTNNIAIATDNGHAVAGNHSVINHNQDELRKQIAELQKQLDEYDRSIAILEARLAEKDAMIKQILEAMASGKQRGV